MKHLLTGKRGLMLSVIFILCCTDQLSAQQEPGAYKGTRLGVFNYHIMRQEEERVVIQCALANTGRVNIKNQPGANTATEELLIELDTVSMPAILHGRDHLIKDAIRKYPFKLKAGEVKYDVVLDIVVKANTISKHLGNEHAKQCPDLVVDTLVLVRYTDKNMLLHYRLRNQGNAAAFLFGHSARSKDNISLNIYLVSGVKLTRGAILAGHTTLKKGRETLDGVLEPGQILEGEVSFSIKNRTKFTPNILLEIDPGLQVEDCNRTNNTKTLVIEF